MHVNTLLVAREYFLLDVNGLIGPCEPFSVNVDAVLFRLFFKRIIKLSRTCMRDFGRCCSYYPYIRCVKKSTKNQGKHMNHGGVIARLNYLT